MCKKLIYLVSFVSVLSIVCTASAELVAYWKFDEGSGTTAFDSTGNGNDGTLNGAQTTAGQIGEALLFDEIDDRVVVPDFAYGPEFTVAFWFKSSSNAGSVYQYMFSHAPYNASNSVNIYFCENSEADAGTLRTALVDVDDATNQTGLDVASGFADGNWHHYALTVGSGMGANVYVDGVLQASLESQGGDAFDPQSDLYLGARVDLNAQRFFGGALDDVQVYNHALTEGEILSAMQGAGAYPYALAPVPADGVLLEDNWVSMSWNSGDYAASHDVYIGDNFDDVNTGTEGTFQGNQTDTSFVVGFPGFPFPDGLVPGTTYYWRIDEVNDTEPNSPWKGKIWSFSVPPRTAYFPEPADGAESIDPNADLSWTGGFGAKLHYVYFGDNFDDVNNATGALPLGSATFDPGPLQLSKTYYWRVDEFDIVETYKGNVWSFTTEGAVESLDPVNGALDVKQTQILTWSPGIYGASHEIYFGTDKDAVRNADTGSPEYKGSRNLGSESYDPGMLEWDTTYYWRIDEVNNTNPDSPWPGILWSFTTANFLVVDDFEDYDVGNNEIWWTWIDGLGYASHPTLPAHPGNGTGSMVGDETTGSYMEETIVHGGSQSMPVFYDNSILRYSEVEKTLTYPRDWTFKGVNTLTIWFRGSAGNAAENLYVALNGNAVVNHDNPNAAQIISWTEWNIDLQAFADQGVNLANVNSITLGLGNKNNPVAGGSGMMYFDDIRLYAP